MMRLVASLENNINLPISYNRGIQGFIYSIAGDTFHDMEGFKGFTFSKIMGRFQIKGQRIVFLNSPVLVISSFNDLAEKVFKNILISESIKLYNTDIKIKSAYLHIDEPEIDIFRTISPVTVYETHQRKTKYFSPDSPDFIRLIKENLRKKHMQFFNQEPGDFDFKVLKTKQKVLDRYKNTLIEAYDIVFSLTGDQNIRKLAYGTGIGAKNPQGFGCIEMGV